MPSGMIVSSGITAFALTVAPGPMTTPAPRMTPGSVVTSGVMVTLTVALSAPPLPSLMV